MWSRGSATEGEVSDVYVRLGYEFNIACRAFNAISVDTTDLGPVPDMLRNILEDTLSQEASQQSLDKYLPRIRDIIINLLHGLKKKQQRLRQKSGGGSSKDGTADPRPPRHTSTASNMSNDSSLNQQLLEDAPTRHTSSRSFPQKSSNGDVTGPDLPPRTTSVAAGRTSPTRHAPRPQESIGQSASRDTVQSDASSLSSNALENIPVIAPYPETDAMPLNVPYEPDMPSPEPPQPPAKHNDALQALQRGGDLERRASRRFSAYHIQKQLGTTMNGIAQIPPAQHSPLPNRGRDLRESMNAVRSRGSTLHGRAKSKQEKDTYEPSPNRLHEVRRISEEPSQQIIDNLPSITTTVPEDQQYDSPTVKTPDDKLGGYPFPALEIQENIGATISGPMEELYVPDTSYISSEKRKATSIVRRHSKQTRQTPPPPQFVPEASPQSGKELTLFLQYKSKIKKFVLADGDDLSIARIQLAFIEKFAWNTHNNGVDLPDIYIQDPVSGVRHELEDLTDIKERSVLVLNVEALDEVKRHIDDGIGNLRRIVEGIKTGLEDQHSAIQRVSERQQETAKELATIAAAPPAAASAIVSPSGTSRRTLSVKDRQGQLSEIQSLRRDLAVVRQTYTSFAADIDASMSTIKTKAAAVKKSASDASTPDLTSNSGRTYVNKGKRQLSEDSEKIVNRVDDLQDLVEDLRKDVVTRGVRPLPRQLEEVSRDISLATSDLKKMQEYLRKEKPIWTKIWEKELQVVCDDRDLLTMQEELATDLEDDLEKAAATFALVEQATKAQNLQNPDKAVGTGSRSTSRTLVIDGAADPIKAKDGVLGEVRALQPNHESRLEAIERAERSRQRELENRKGGEFQRELGNFVEEGKLKKSGGVEEVERIRKQRDEQTRKEVHENLLRREQERAEKLAAKEAAAAAAQAAGASEEADPSSSNSAPAPAPDESTAHLPNGHLEPHAPPTHETTRESSPEPVFEEANEIITGPPPLDHAN
nr:bud site selection protein 6 [Quercus suber]